MANARFRPKITYILAFIAVLWFLVAFVIYPNIGLLSKVFWVDSHFSLTLFHKIFSSAIAVKALGNSLLLGLCLAITANIIGVFMVLVVNYFDIKGAKYLNLGYLTTIIYSGIVVASGYLFIYGESGFVTKFLQYIWPHLSPDWFTGFPAVLFLMTFATTANHMMFLTTSIKKIDYQTIEAARSLGAGQWRILRQIVLPALVPTLTTLTIMLFNTGLGAMSAPLILGGNHFATITPTILTFAGSSATYDLAAGLSLLLGALQIVMLLVGRWLDQRKRYAFKTKVSAPMRKQKITKPFWNILVHIGAYLIWSILLLPLIATVIFSFTNATAVITAKLGHFTLANYLAILSTPETLNPFITSIVYSILSAAMAILISMLVARMVTARRQTNPLEKTMSAVMYIPWLLPAPLIAIGLITTFGVQHLIVANQVLTGGLLLMFIGYTVTRLPFSLKFLESIFYSMDGNYEEAAQSLGASLLYRFWTVVLPQMKDGILAIFAMNVLAHLADYDLSVFLFSPLLQPLGVVIKANTDPSNALTGSGAVNGVVANLIYSVLLMIISSVLLIIVRRRPTKVGNGLI
ncbi:ABC transporter permease [Leuconostoc citreum]|uniref:ABC transporter permease n=1 Tax=Leuconostoc citreum TaxID=33964 RepID=UPI0011BB1235|nr:iron ABC transporter permease [Leuconostoc citreum]QEA56049.1 iron ABC transporter permease [Leuconostoc citreum]